MKKFLIWAIALLLPALVANAQDIITKKDGTDVKAKITDVNSSEIKYKRFDNLDGPTFTINKSEVLMIRYANGTNEVFNSQPAAQPQSQPRYNAAPAYNNAANNHFFASNPSRLREGMKYKHIKDLYNKNDYDALEKPKYSGSRAWMNLLVPGLAQYTMGEGGLGTRYLLLPLGGEAIMGLGYYLMIDGGLQSKYQDEDEILAGSIVTLAGAAFTLTWGILSITNAAKVAKVKSLYEDDMAKMHQGYSFTVAPTVMPAYTPQGLKVAPGVGMRVTF